MINDDMVKIPATTFTMGSESFYPNEGPVHQRAVDAFLIDRYPVTNAQFSAFVQETGYVTVAERPLTIGGVEVSDIQAQPGSLVFTPTSGAVPLDDWRQWWRWVPGTSWRSPKGPGTHWTDWHNHPVIHIAYEDASSYASWAGKRLPTEAEHEYASHGGGQPTPFSWGQEPYPGGIAQAHTWIGDFPHMNRGRFGAHTAPVGSYPANGFGLRDMIGNVWEWTSDRYTERHFPAGAAELRAGGRTVLLDTGSQQQTSRVEVQRVLKGGSFLCSPDYCLRFRPAARSPQEEDTGASHIGFRCAQDERSGR